MAQLTVRLSDDLDRALAAAAHRLHRKRSEVVRLALRRFLESDSPGIPAEQVKGLLGAVETGVPDLAENHRSYVLESLHREP